MGGLYPQSPPPLRCATVSVSQQFILYVLPCVLIFFLNLYIMQWKSLSTKYHANFRVFTNILSTFKFIGLPKINVCLWISDVFKWLLEQFIKNLYDDSKFYQTFNRNKTNIIRQIYKLIFATNSITYLYQNSSYIEIIKSYFVKIGI